MNDFQKTHPQVKTVAIQMDNGNFARVGKFSAEIPRRLSCERGVGSGCNGTAFDLWEFLEGRIKHRDKTGHIFHRCQGRQEMGRTGSRECLAELHGTFWIEYEEDA